jgi:hypothetical protein
VEFHFATSIRQVRFKFAARGVKRIANRHLNIGMRG